MHVSLVIHVAIVMHVLFVFNAYIHQVISKHSD